MAPVSGCHRGRVRLWWQSPLRFLVFGAGLPGAVLRRSAMAGWELYPLRRLQRVPVVIRWSAVSRVVGAVARCGG